MRAAGSWPTSAITLMTGNVTEGKIASGMPVTHEPAGDGEQAHDDHDREGAVVRPVEQAHGREATAAPSGRPTWPATTTDCPGASVGAVISVPAAP